MIVNHRHKFIFLKTRKTASTSVEIALSRFCDENDIVTWLPKEDERTRASLGIQGGTCSARTVKSILDRSPRDWVRTLKGRPPVVDMDEHIPAAQIANLVGRDAWNSYFKFSIERDPWEVAISQYYFKTARRPRDSFTFREFLEERDPAYPITNWDVYAMDGQVVTDFMVRYERLEMDLAEVGRRIGLPEPLTTNGLHAKGGFRKDRRPAAEFMTPEEIELVARICHREVAEFGHQAPTLAAT